MISEDGSGLSFPDICLTVEEKPRKKPQPGKLSPLGIEPGPARWEATMLPLDHNGGHKQGVSKLLLLTSKGCRGDLVDKVMMRHPCPETYHFDKNKFEDRNTIGWYRVSCVSELVLQTYRGCRGDLVDKVLIRHPCPETYHFDVK